MIQPSLLNYHHLRYFWEVARHGSLRVAAEKLNISQPTISAQIKALEELLGVSLFSRSGRGLKLTPQGRLVMEYANDIFGLGAKMLDALSGTGGAQGQRLRIGITDSFAKLFAWNLIRPAVRQMDQLTVTCTEGRTEELLAQLVLGRLDMVLADEPAPASMPIRAFSHLLGNAPVTFCAGRSWVKKLKKNFPDSLRGAPLLMPTPSSAWRLQLDHWFETNGLRPRVVAEFDDSALMKTAAADGFGVVPVATTVVHDATTRYDLHPLGDPIDCSFAAYIITVESSLKHPAVQLIARASREVLLQAESSA